MQDPYSNMMSPQQRSDHYKPYNPPTMHSNRANGPQTQPSTDANAYYHGLQQYANYAPNPETLYNAMTLPTNMGQQQDYAPLPAHMGNQNALTNSNGISRVNPTSHTISHTATSPPITASSQGSDLNMSNLSSPGPSTSRLSMSPEGQSGSSSNQSHHMSSNLSPGEIVKNESSDSGSVKSGHEDDSGVPPKKRTHDMTQGSREEGYWEKRKKNNESAKRSREARRMKEETIAMRVVYLEQENLQLRTEVSLLKSEIEKLRCMLYNS
ncbi:thyrotroph embryonic factor-like [Mya arenaria]|uniref:thyrotroph embryonic factor-like n=1 Tax=Mya arenaria TaxID=6604 RepID=UPI0022E5BCAF|nr:thyrotroph embryonic factor-like [Mya arenaria]